MSGITPGPLQDSPNKGKWPQKPVYVIVPAAGSGSRMKLDRNKQFLELGRYPVIIRTLRVFERHPRVSGIIVLAAADETDAMHRLIASYGLKKCLAVSPGGSTRQESVALGLALLVENTGISRLDLAVSLVLVHDGARCFVTGDVIDRVIHGIWVYQACGAAVAVRDTIKQAEPGGKVLRTLPRDQLWAMQTPQGALYPLLQQAYDLAAQTGFQATDDCSVLEWAGVPVYLVEGDSGNIKLTTPEDRILGEQLALISDRDDVP
jgi:2-C-methyl-D-erythritol 4-phosphate cytidylyltransferase